MKGELAVVGNVQATLRVVRKMFVAFCGAGCMGAALARTGQLDVALAGFDYSVRFVGGLG